MKTWDERVNAEIKSYLRWLRVMERSIPPRRKILSRTYKGNLLTLYTRVGQDEALDDAPAICLANITVTSEHRRQGFLTALLASLDRQSDLLRAEWITVECVNNPYLAGKLDTLGFSRFDASEGAAPCFFRKFPFKTADPITSGFTALSHPACVT